MSITRTNVDGGSVLGAGTRLAERYRIEELVGVGAMGMVYRVRDEILGVDVALKVLRPELADDEVLRERFRRELVLARQVTHPHVVRIHDLGETSSGAPGAGSGRPLRYLTMDFVPGRSLRQLLAEEGPLPVERAVSLAGQLAEALAAAHRQGVIHRDLKPSNVLIDDRGEARVTDFGVARSVVPTDGAVQPALTREGGVVGTPEYLSPEQVRGTELDGRSDLYALGLILFEMLTGELPFRGGTLEETLGQRLAARPRTLRDAGLRAHPDLEAVLDRCLAREASDRYPDGTALARDLAACVAGDRRIARRWSGRQRLVTTALAVVTVVGAVVGAWWLLVDGRPAGLREAEPEESSAAGPGAPAPVPAVAVLPLAEETGRTDLAWAPGGLAELLASDLAESTAIRVVDAARVARTVESLGFEGGVPPPAEARQLAELLDADRLVTGALRATEGRLRIEARLIAGRRDAAGGDATGGQDAFGVEAAPGESLVMLVGRLGKEIRSRLAVSEPVDRAPPSATDSSEALAAYSEGIARLHLGDAVGAAPLLEAAVAADDGFAAAWVGLAKAREVLGRHRTALTAARRGIAELPAAAGRLAYEARAQEAKLEGDPAAARRILGELVERYPNDVAARVALAEAYGDEGRFPEASRLLEAVTEEEPNHPRAWYLLGKYAILSGDSRRAADEFLVRALVIQNRLHNDQGRADVLNALGIAFDDLGERAEAVARYREAAALRRELGDRRGYAATLTNLGVLHFLDGDFDEGRSLLEEALAILQELGDPVGVADLQNELGILEEEQGRYAAALDHYRRALAVRRDLGDRRALAESYNNVGFAYFLLGELDNAEVYWRQALELYGETENREGVVIATQSMGLLDLVRGRWSAALEAFLEALEESRELGLRQAEAVSLGNLGRIAQYQGRYAAALKSYREALAQVEELGDARGQAEFGLFRASALLDMGLLAEAEEQLEETRGPVVEVANREQQAELQVLTAEVSRRRGRSDASRAALQRALSGARASGSRMAELSARWALARIDLEAGPVEDGLRALRSVVDEAEEVGYRVIELGASVDLARGLLDTGRIAEAEARARRALHQAGDSLFRDRWRLHGLLAEALEARGERSEADAHRTEARRELDRLRQGAEDLDSAMWRPFEELPEVKKIARRTDR